MNIRLPRSKHALSFEATLAGTFLALAALLTVIAAVVWQAKGNFEEADEERAHRLQTLDALATVMTTLVDAETGTAGFVITGDEEFLSPYREAAARIDDRLRRVRELTAGEAREQRLFTELNRLAPEMLAFRASVIQKRRDLGLEAARRSVASGAGRRQMDLARSLVAAMEAEEEAMYGRNKADRLASRRVLEAMLWTSTGVMLAFLAGSYVFIRAGYSARKRSQEELRQTRNYLENLIDHANASIIVCDPAFRITRFNMASQNLTGYPEGEAIGRELDMLFPGESRAESMAKIDAALGGERRQSVEIPILRKDGDVSITLWSSANIYAADGSTLSAIIAQGVDITERKRAEDLVRRSARELAVRNRVAEIFLTVPDEEMYARVLAVILEVMESEYGVFGYLDEQGGLVVPTMAQTVWGRPQAPDKQFVFPREMWGESTWPRAILEKRTICMNEPSILTPESLITVNRHISMPLIHKGGVVGLIQVANRESDYRSEDVALLEVIGISIAPVLAAMLKREREEAARLQAERTLQAALADLKRSNQDLEQFAYVASHDLKEPLRMVASYTQLLAQRYEDKLDDKARVYIGYAVEGAVRMQRMISDLLAYSRIRGTGRPPEPTDSHHALGEAVKNLAAAIQESGAVVTNGDLPAVRADATQLAQVFQNLVGNAIKFRKPGKPSCVHVSASHGPAADRPEWVFVVRDNGIGIDPKFQKKLFVIFQRLHGRNEYPGTGIGLALCRCIVERHGGRIWFESAPGEGSAFCFTLPE